MSAQDVETLRGLYEDWAKGDYSRADVFAPDIELSIEDEFPDIMLEPGYKGFLATMRMWLSSWEDFAVDAKELIDLDEHVVAIVEWHGISKYSGGLVKRNSAHLWRMRDGKAVSLKLCRDRAEAFVAASAAAAD
jgi:ketosteroid isomerase-like protein